MARVSSASPVLCRDSPQPATVRSEGTGSGTGVAQIHGTDGTSAGDLVQQRSCLLFGVGHKIAMPCNNYLCSWLGFRLPILFAGIRRNRRRPGQISPDPPPAWHWSQWRVDGDDGRRAPTQGGGAGGAHLPLLPRRPRALCHGMTR